MNGESGARNCGPTPCGATEPRSKCETLRDHSVDEIIKKTLTTIFEKAYTRTIPRLIRDQFKITLGLRFQVGVPPPIRPTNRNMHGGGSELG